MKNDNDKRTSKPRNTTSWCHLRQIRKQRVGGREGRGGRTYRSSNLRFLLNYWHFHEIWLQKTQPCQRLISEIFHLPNEPVVLYELVWNLDSTLNGYWENSAQTRHESTMFEFCDHVWPAITFPNKDIEFSCSVSQITVTHSTNVLSFVTVRWSQPTLQVVNFANFFEETKIFKFNFLEF